MTTMSPELSVGTKNIYFARSFLEGEEIPVIAKEVGGQFYRNSRFFFRYSRSFCPP